MISHVIEYNCQYSDQIRKKHKTWHDGKLKYYQANNRFMLYPEDSNVLISSNFISNQREVSTILDTEGFNMVEHKIFNRAVVIITDVVCEYDREVQIQKAGQSQTFSMQRKGSLIHRSDSQTERVTTVSSVSTSDNLNQKIPRKRILIGNDERGVKGHGKVSLALKFNKPFKQPMLTNGYSRRVQPKYRPARRNARTVVQEDFTNINQALSNPERDKKATEKPIPKHQGLVIDHKSMNKKDNYEMKKESAIWLTSSIQRERKFKRKHISHTPINI